MVPSAETALALRYVEAPHELIPGNALQLLRNGEEAFPAWIAAIDGAQARVSMEMYIFNDDQIGRRVGDALARAAARGVEVRLLYDFVGCRYASPGFFARLRHAGVHTIAYHRYRFWRPRFWALFRRNHRKTLVCDGALAFAGGINIADEWLPTAEGGGGWHDAVIQVRGPAAAAIEATFLRTWNRRAKRRAKLDPDKLPRPALAGPSSVAVIGNTELLERFAIRRAALHAIAASQERIFLANPYFVPDSGFLCALRRAAERGIDVRLLVPAASDTRTLDYAARATFSGLLASGVRIWQHEAVVHTKALLVDRHFVSIGSYNLDHRSLAYNLELVANTTDAALNEATARMLEDDMVGAEEIRREVFERRSVLVRAIERIAYSLRHWL